MLRARISVPDERAVILERELLAAEGLRRIGRMAAAGGGAVVEADVDLEVADELITTLEQLGLGPEDFVVSQLEIVAPVTSAGRRLGATTGFAWIEVLGVARENARPLGRYFALMAVAGALAALGVIKGNSILIVGAMAVSPDLLPLCSMCVGVVGRRWALFRTALGTLVLGLALVGGVAAAVAALVAASGFDSHIVLGTGGLHSLATTDYSTVLVALAAGIAAMLAFETRASAAVGVAISVTTIPASAYWGVAVGAGEAQGAGGALVVLVVNVCLLIVSGSITLAVQTWLARRRDERAAAGGDRGV